MTSVDEIVAFLSKVPLFHDLKDAQLRKLAKHLREREYAADEVILEQGKHGVGLFVMVLGEAKVVRTQIDGTVFELDRLHRTDFFGELSLLDESPRSASVITVTPTKCLALEKLLFLDEISSDPEMAVAMLKTLAQRYRRLIQNM
ncbi:MAG TPA: cyclic nucleotide-binding domain-containing protein [Phototrophicaceae bacterium]|jgi:CRP-like cAMP-binding protein|nr:cyclic nucleotide-binding domain-containing protein [Phototrophicaceae bacterium]